MTDVRLDAVESSGLQAEGAARARLVDSVRGLPSWAVAGAGVVVIVVVWQLVSLSFSPAGDGSVPAPWRVVVTLVQDLGTGVTWNAIAQTSASAGLGYLWGNLIALALAFVVLLLPFSESLATQLAVVASCVPLTAIGPIVALMSPAQSRITSVFLAALSVIFTTTVGALLGLRSASATQLDVVRAYGGSRLTELRKVRLIAAAPSLLAAFKIAAPAAFLGAVLGEYFLIGVDSGLGLQLLAASATNTSLQIWAIALISAGIAGLAYFLIGLIGRLLTPWSSDGAGKGMA
ncbi:ABC transporter permease [uncultured Amnibacterium sp.]|uniref:ABC transporter permease n=1 Tax=uncultured Amnibacterium sp. TaxID=1631851 RepID=UPI0035CA6E18